MLGTPASFWTRFTTASTGTNSILALGTNGNVSITTAGSATTVLNADANFASTSKSITVDLSSSFGNIIAGSQSGSIIINGNALNSPYNGGGTGGASSITITENNAPVVLNNGESVTPAEWAAILQLRTTGSQTIQLDSSGTAIGGTLTLSANNIPTGGFQGLTVPVGLTIVDGVPAVTFATDVTIDGTFDASIQTGAATVSTPSLTINGNVVGSGGGLTFQSTAASLPVTIGPNTNINLNGGTISGTTLNITNNKNPLSLATTASMLNVNSTGDVSIINTGSVALGTISAPNFAVTAAPSATITTTKDITTAGVLSLTASSIVNDHILSGSQINLVGNNTTGNFTVGGSGTITSTISTSLVSTLGNLTFASGSSLQFNGNTTLVANGANQSVEFGSGSSVTNNGAMTLLTSSVLGSMSSITGNSPTMISASGKGTIANPNGDVVLPAGFTYAGSDLAILAFGNIRATGATTLNLSSTKGDAGDLTLIAGYNFVGNASDSAYKTTATGLYTIESQNSAGGSIYLPRASINLSTSAVNAKGGTVIAVANGGTTESGMIALGPINTSARSGTAGSVTLIGEGGIHTGAINASGGAGGQVQLIGAAPSVTAGAVNVANGTLINSAAITHSPTSSVNGAGILVSGSINTSGSKQRAGDVTLLSDAQIGVTGGITANGLQTTATQAGGNVNINAGLDVSVKQAITVNGLSAASATSVGDAGNISISAGALINTSALQAIGGRNTGTGDGGKGGSIVLSTQKILVGLTQMGLGSVKVAGTIDARGGDASKTLGANGGKGGSVSLDAGAVAVTGSINASGGAKGKGTTGGDGSVDIHTYAIQSFPSSFDLTSNRRTIVALPGALFTMGTVSSPNGVGGTIKVGSTVIDRKLNALITSATTLPIGPVSISVIGGASGLLNSASLAAFDATTGKRSLVTPAEAVALYQTSHAGSAAAQTLSLASDGSILQPANSTPISIPATELDSITFTAFKQLANVALSLTGARPVLNLPSSSVLGGTIDFPTPGSVGYINTGSGAFNLQATGKITSASTVILSGTGGTWSNNGQIQAGTLALARPNAAAMTFVTTSGAQTTATTTRIGTTSDVGMTMTFRASPTAQFNTPIEFGGVPIPAIYASASTAAAANASTARNVSLTFDMPNGTPTVGGIANVTSMKLIALNTTPLKIENDASFTTGKTLSVNAGAGGIAIGDSVHLESGVLSNAAPDWNSSALLTTKQVVAHGAMTIKSGGSIAIGSKDTFITNGGNESIVTTAGDLDIVNNNTFRVMGGNLSVFAAGIVNGGSGNAFQAKGTTTGANGGIEIGAGATTSTLAAAFSKKAGTQIGVAALNSGGLTNISQTKGALVVNPLSQGSGTFAPTSSITMNSGAVVFDLIGTGVDINLGTTTFETKASKPIGYAEQAGNEFVLDTDDDE